MSLEIDPKQIRSFSPINSLNPGNAQDLIKKIKATGVHIPTMKEVYEPVLEEMKTFGMELTHYTEEIKD